METPPLNSEQLKGSCGGCRNSLAIAIPLVGLIWLPIVLFCPPMLSLALFPLFGIITCLPLIFPPKFVQLSMKLRIVLVDMIAYFTIFAEGRALPKEREITTVATILMFLAFLAWFTYIGPKISLFMKKRANSEDDEKIGSNRAALTAVITNTNNDYEILGVSSTSSLVEIKKAFREKCTLLHPANNPSGDLQAFNKLANSYATLIEKQERKNSLSRNAKS